MENIIKIKYRMLQCNFSIYSRETICLKLRLIQKKKKKIMKYCNMYISGKHLATKVSWQILRDFLYQLKNGYFSYHAQFIFAKYVQTKKKTKTHKSNTELRNLKMLNNITDIVFILLELLINNHNNSIYTTNGLRFVLSTM